MYLTNLTVSNCCTRDSSFALDNNWCSLELSFTVLVDFEFWSQRFPDLLFRVQSFVRLFGFESGDTDSVTVFSGFRYRRLENARNQLQNVIETTILFKKSRFFRFCLFDFSNFSVPSKAQHYHRYLEYTLTYLDFQCRPF